MEKTLGVNGMTCGHCEKAVKGALTELAGVEEVTVYLDEAKVKVVYNEAVVDLGDIRSAIEDQGYDVVQ